METFDQFETFLLILAISLLSLAIICFLPPKDNLIYTNGSCFDIKKKPSKVAYLIGFGSFFGIGYGLAGTFLCAYVTVSALCYLISTFSGTLTMGFGYKIYKWWWKD